MLPAGAAVRLLAEDEEAPRIVAVAVRDPSRPRTDLPDGARVISEPADLGDLDVDLVVEAAGRDSVLPWGRVALAAGTDFVISSASAS